MKKILTILSLILALSLFGACGHKHSYSTDWSSDANSHWHTATCHEDEKKDLASHNLVDSGNVDENGYKIYVCSVCGFTHQHIYDAEKWESNGREHWHPVTCGHTDAKLFNEEHSFDGETGLCEVCGYDENSNDGYEVAFAYYLVDENGSPIVDDSGYYSQVGVTYTSVEQNGSLPIDTINGGILYAGDVISFTVQKSVFCYYTDAADRPLVEVISGSGEGQNTVETIYPDEDGVYTVTIQDHTIISVANVATSPRTITGTGTQQDPFIINSEVDWLYFAMYVNDKSYYSIEYNIGYWKLNADLDFEGESIYVVGDGYSSANSVFCGNFDGNGHKISNFVLENSISSSVGEGYSNYIGLFGVVTGYVGVDSVIANVTVENLTINATAGKNDIVSAGCIVGYGVGANIRNCVVKNCQINIMADDTYMSFAGGMVGYLQSGMTEDGMLFYSSVAYSVAENLTIKGSGMLYSAGGIAGRVVSYNEQVTSFVINCYSIGGKFSDAVRVGGIVGELQRFSALQNCYSTDNVSAYATTKTAIQEEFAGSVLDDRYAYAGGIVAYAENDTVVEGCFFDGSVFATALAGSGYAKKGNIVAGYSKAQYADYYAKQVISNNQADGATINNDYIKNQLKWNEADWTFGEGYPTINQTEVAHNFTVKINIDGQDKYTFAVGSQYLPLSYWYILDGNYNDGQKTISRFYSSGSKRTYGYFFDSALTLSVPEGYVPMRDTTLYASYKDTAAVAGDYYISNNGIAVELTLNTDGTYYYEEGAVLLRGEYSFDGQILTFKDAYFARIAESATPSQQAYQYTFWATVNQNGDLSLFDCEKEYVVTEDNEALNPTFTTMARFYPVSSPLTIVSVDNLSFTGGYYYSDASAKHVFEFNNDYTGLYKKYSGTSVLTDTFSFSIDNNQNIVISLTNNGAQFIASVTSGIPTSIEDNRGDDYTLSKIDEFVGVWEKSATSHKLYTFDGMGNWSYEHYVYLVEENLVNAQKQIVNQDSGTYTFDGQGNLLLTRQENGQDIDVVATIVDGVVYVTENGQPVKVEFNNENGYKGVWYTANNKIIRYTLTLNGLNAKGVGTATLDGFGTAPLALRYTAVSSDTLYLYVDNIVYAVLTYSSKTGLFDGMFYNSATGSTTTPQTLYLYDDFYGEWVSDIDVISNIKFNGFGAHNTTDTTGDFLAVKGIATIGNTTVNYTIDRATGNAEFTYNSVKYTLSYNEYTNEITVSYGGANGVLAKADNFANMILIGEQTTYKFDGRGNFALGGTVIANDVIGTYKIQANGNVLMTFDGQADQTIVVNKEGGVVTGYTLNDVSLYVDNAFSGVWAIPGQNVSITVGNILCLPSVGQTIEIQGYYNGNAVTMYFNGIDTITFEYNGKQYSLVDTLGGSAPALILSETVTVTTPVTTQKIVVLQDDFFGVWKKDNGNKNTLTFDGCGASGYVSSGKVSDKNGNVTYKRNYKIVNGVVTIYDVDTGRVYATFTQCAEGTAGAYVNGDRWYQLNIV